MPSPGRSGARPCSSRCGPPVRLATRPARPTAGGTRIRAGYDSDPGRRLGSGPSRCGGEFEAPGAASLRLCCGGGRAFVGTPPRWPPGPDRPTRLAARRLLLTWPIRSVGGPARPRPSAPTGRAARAAVRPAEPGRAPRPDTAGKRPPPPRKSLGFGRAESWARGRRPQPARRLDGPAAELPARQLEEGMCGGRGQPGSRRCDCSAGHGAGRARRAARSGPKARRGCSSGL
jgi:hypothetical protein